MVEHPALFQRFLQFLRCRRQLDIPGKPARAIGINPQMALATRFFDLPGRPTESFGVSFLVSPDLDDLGAIPIPFTEGFA